MKISLRPQRKNPERTSIYINGKYAFSVDKDTLAQLSLYDKQEITKRELEHLLFESEKQKCKDYAYLLLSYRMRTKKEIEDRLRHKDFSPSIIKDVMTELENQGLIDDRKFAQAFARDRINFSLKGKHLIFAELRKKGISQQDIESVLNDPEIINGEESALKRIIEKYQNRYKKYPLQERKQKFYTLLTRRGFSYPMIKKVLKIEEN
ncbi:MAG: RecX family transcriptional regulator [candidate division WOR-3 bacterium]|nr:RecX family transcriptional regulator [candidate division WOR-3 bacterium]